MTTATAVARAGILLVFAAPAEAQRSVPTGVQRFQTFSQAERAPAAARRDTVEQERAWEPLGAVAGGVLGAGVGGFVGAMIGAAVAEGCSERYCGLVGAVMGFGVGEPIGVALGTHFGGRGRGNVMLTTLTSFGILVAGLYVGGGSSPSAVAIPALQIAAAMAIERRATGSRRP